MGLTVVVVDDTPDYRLMVRSLLASVSETMSIVGEAADGELGLALVRRKRPDIAISDLMMPRLDGFELARRMREELPQTTIIIIISSHTEDSYRALASAAARTPSSASRCSSAVLSRLSGMPSPGGPRVVTVRRQRAHHQLRRGRRPDLPASSHPAASR